MPTADLHPASLDEQTLLEACQVQRSRRSGPGGQHRNKVETAVVISHRPTGITGEASERRSQAQNRSKAIFRLRVNLALEVRTRREPLEAPTVMWRKRCRGGRIAVNPEHVDFPTLLAEALDVIDACRMEIRAAAKALGVTASQLLKLLRLESRALDRVNDQRQELGLRRLK
jgi:hypothetical protein